MKQPILSDSNAFLTIENSYKKSTLCLATITISKELVNFFFEETARLLQGSVQAYGFQQGKVPLEYVIKQYKVNILEHLKEFFFKFGIVNFLFQEIRAQKILVAGEPRLFDISLDYNASAKFVFELTLFPFIDLLEWKFLPFKSPARKNYKDLDRQVDGFVQEEKNALDGYGIDGSTAIEIGDWVNFDISIATEIGQLIEKNFVQNFWLKLGDEEIDGHLRALFLGRHKGECFVADNKGLQDYFSDQLRASYRFNITIVDFVSSRYFCLDRFKDHFKIKTNKDMHKKLIEVFSYRNDISQRLAMVEEVFKLLLSKHRFFPPEHLVSRQQKIILSAIQKNPDYNVYRKEKDFSFWVRQLAEKQVKETLLIDQLIYNENIVVNHDDIVSYLNLDKRPRMRDFIYFSLPDVRREGQEMPWPRHEIGRFCAREKAINSVIYHLTKK